MIIFKFESHMLISSVFGNEVHFLQIFKFHSIMKMCLDLLYSVAKLFIQTLPDNRKGSNTLYFLNKRVGKVFGFLDITLNSF